MAYLPSLPAAAVLLDVSRAHPQIARPLLDYDQALLSCASPLTLVFLAVWGPAGHGSEPRRRRGRYFIDVCPAGISGSHPQATSVTHRRRDGRFAC